MAPSFPVDFSGQRKTKKCPQKGLSQMMGKTRKISKGYSSGGFVPDDRHAVENMAAAESEGFGSAGRVDDTELTATEDSCATKRRCISLSASKYNQFGVPVRVLSLSKMSHSERKNLEVSLKHELEQIKVLHKRFDSLNSNVVAMSPTGNIHSCNDGQKRLAPPKSKRLVGVSTSQGKKRAPPGRKGPHTKRPAAGRSDLMKQALPLNASNATLTKQCQTLLNKLMQHQHSWVFNTPVDVVKLKIPDYYDVIKHPMDLGTVKTKLSSGEYSNPLTFAADVRLTFSNAMTYNPPGHDVYMMAEMLGKYFETGWKQIEKKLHATTSEPARSKSTISIEIETAKPMLQAAHLKSSASIETETAKCMPWLEHSKPSVYVEIETAKPMPQQENKIKQEPCKRAMTKEEKHKLSSELEALLAAELPESIIYFLKVNSCNGNQMSEDEDEIEIDIETLSDDTLFGLRKLLDNHYVYKQKTQAKTEPSVMEPHNGSGSSNSSLQPCKGNDLIDEEVYIGGNDLPISSFPSAEVEKDTALRNAKRSSSSSSSGDSGSSSSESEFSTSSSSKVDGAKASVRMNTAKETVCSGANIEQKKINLGSAIKRKHSLYGVHQVEQDCQSQPLCIEADGHPEGESAPPERQSSPDKLYRAALLRSRFADTILKAQEKTTFGKDEKQGRKKLRPEKEELERRRKEEKARLQAEAKAAEEALKKAEAEAAAEAKRKRELEREAARQALQKMEKTVDINENCQFMGGLEMLGVAPDDSMQSLVDETSPEDNYSDGVGLGSFKFQASSNPLEQLGLYMKDDDEEEDEPQCVSPAVEDDPEEGEID
ncbi:hypothetical protein LguiA_009680 [Lonicera macranthoides]